MGNSLFLTAPRTVVFIITSPRQSALWPQLTWGGLCPPVCPYPLYYSAMAAKLHRGDLQK